MEISEMKKLAFEICRDRYKCEKAGLDYNKIDYDKAMLYVLKQEINRLEREVQMEEYGITTIKLGDY